MPKQRKASEEIIQAVKAYLSGQGKMKAHASMLGVKKPQFCEWVVKYQTFGSAGLLPSSKTMKQHIACEISFWGTHSLSSFLYLVYKNWTPLMCQIFIASRIYVKQSSH